MRGRPLTETHPGLAVEADGWDPTTVSFGMAKKVSWRCPEGHTYQASPNKRSSGRGCPYCSGRLPIVGTSDLATTHPELASTAYGWDPTTVTPGSHRKLEWLCDKDPNHPHTWTMTVGARVSGQGCSVCAGRQVCVGFNDLASTHPEIAAEADGWDPTTVTAGSNKVRAWRCGEGHSSKKAVNQRTRGYGCAVCAGLRVEVGYNDLASTHPEIAAEADGWDPTTFVPDSEKRVPWTCGQCGYRWSARISPRTRRGVGCPRCAGHVLVPGTNDCATTHPDLAVEALGWDPTTVFAATKTKLWWKCSACGHEWKSTGDNRRRSGCPACAKYGYDPTSPGWLYLIEHHELGLLQIGITNEPDVRLTSHGARGWMLVDLLGPMDGSFAREQEKSILQMLRGRGATFTKAELAGTFSGYTESWTATSYLTTSLGDLIETAVT
jgi:hypothetical protein